MRPCFSERPIVPLFLLAAVVSAPVLLVVTLVTILFQWPTWSIYTCLATFVLAILGYVIVQTYDDESPRPTRRTSK